MRELIATSYDSAVHTDESLLYKHKLIDPVSLSNNLTYLYGKDSDMFPLTFMSQGQGGMKSIKPKELNDTQYTYDIMGRMKHTSKVVSLSNTSNTKPGLGFTPFDVIMEDNWFHKMYSATSPDGMHQVRVQTEGQLIGAKQYKYTFMIMGGDPTEYITLDNFLNGKTWVMGATSVASTLSDGTTSNQMFPGKMTNQFGFHRYSKEITGNIGNKVTNIEFDLEGGGKTNLWMPFEMELWEKERRQLNEEDLWWSKYNRDSNGVVTLLDADSGKPIPKGAGVKEILCSFGQYDTYGATLTKAKFDGILSSIFSNRVDDTPMEIVLYGGQGARAMFHNAIMSDAISNNYFTPLGEQVITGGIYMTYGKYFNQYKTIDGKILTVKTANLFDHGTDAERQRANGEMYNGLPLMSYTMVALDQSKTNNGERNIQMVCEKGREVITGIYRGLTPLPGCWGAISGELLSDKKDLASYEVMTSDGIAITNATTSFWMDMKL